MEDFQLRDFFETLSFKSYNLSLTLQFQVSHILFLRTLGCTHSAKCSLFDLDKNSYSLACIISYIASSVALSQGLLSGLLSGLRTCSLSVTMLCSEIEKEPFLLGIPPILCFSMILPL